MPSKSVLEQKQAYVADLAEKLKNAAGGVLVDYKGISVEADTKLRKDLREVHSFVYLSQQMVFRHKVVYADYFTLASFFLFSVQHFINLFYYGNL